MDTFSYCTLQSGYPQIAANLGENQLTYSTYDWIYWRLFQANISRIPRVRSVCTVSQLPQTLQHRIPLTSESSKIQLTIGSESSHKQLYLKGTTWSGLSWNRDPRVQALAHKYSCSYFRIENASGTSSRFTFRGRSQATYMFQIVLVGRCRCLVTHKPHRLHYVVASAQLKNSRQKWESPPNRVEQKRVMNPLPPKNNILNVCTGCIRQYYYGKMQETTPKSTLPTPPNETLST